VSACFTPVIVVGILDISPPVIVFIPSFIKAAGFVYF
jgi:hypothetical protein